MDEWALRKPLLWKEIIKTLEVPQHSLISQKIFPCRWFSLTENKLPWFSLIWWQPCIICSALFEHITLNNWMDKLESVKYSAVLAAGSNWSIERHITWEAVWWTEVGISQPSSMEQASCSVLQDSKCTYTRSYKNTNSTDIRIILLSSEKQCSRANICKDSQFRGKLLPPLSFWVEQTWSWN